MSHLRQECTTTEYRPALPDDHVLDLVLASVSRRRTLAHGHLNVGAKHCALGWFWKDHPKAVVNTSLVDEIAAFNDSFPRATPQRRWQRVVAWLRKRVRE